MPSTGITYPGTGATGGGAGTAWTNASNITAESNAANCAIPSSNAESEHLFGTNFGFAIPTAAEIDGIEVRINGVENTVGSVFYVDVNLTKDGSSLIGTNKASGSLGSSPATDTFGDPMDLWGTTWTPAEINASTFGLACSFQNIHLSAASDTDVSYYTINVYYSINADALVASATAAIGTPNAALKSHATAVSATARVFGSIPFIDGNVRADADRASSTATAGASNADLTVSSTAPSATAAVYQSTSRVLIFGLAIKASATATVNNSATPNISVGRVQSLSAVRSPFTTVTLSWTEVPGGASYKVLQADARRAAFVEVATPSTNSQVIGSLTEGTSYNFKVKAVSSSGDVGLSSSVVFTKGKNTTL